MKFVLFAFMVASGATGPMVPIAVTAYFEDKAACEAAAVALTRVSRLERVSGRGIQHECVPTSSEAK